MLGVEVECMCVWAKVGKVEEEGGGNNMTMFTQTHYNHHTLEE